MSPTDCAYAPAGEYIKDHTLLFHDGWWHLYSISGTTGYCHGSNGNEETFSWSISQDLVNWEMRGHVLHASQWPDAFDRDEVWAPFCMKADNRFYLFYTGIIHPFRPMEYRKRGHDIQWNYAGHSEIQGLAVSDDLTRWTKVADFKKGLGIPGRDSHVVRDEPNGRWLLYSTGRGLEAYVSSSTDLLHWNFIGTCATFPEMRDEQGRCVSGINESLTVMRHPLTGKWILLANFHYAVSDDPTNFRDTPLRTYLPDPPGHGQRDHRMAGQMVPLQHVRQMGSLEAGVCRNRMDSGWRLYVGKTQHHG